jgi:hypothetical protein
MDPTYQNVVLRVWTDYMEKERGYPSDCVIRILYGGTTQASPGRKLMVGMWEWEGTESYQINDVVGWYFRV